MILRLLASLREAGFPHPTLVVGYGADRIAATVGSACRLVEQREQLGTGDAARVGVQSLPEAVGRIVLVHGDEPLIPAGVYARMMSAQRETGAPLVLLTTETDDTRGFGRVVRGSSGEVTSLVQEADLTAEQRALREVNLGAYVFDAAFLRDRVESLHPHPPKGEYYLTDLVAIAAQEGTPAIAVSIPGGEAVMGINDLVQLERATGFVYRATNERLMLSGVTIVDSAATWIDEDVEIGEDSILYPGTSISAGSRLGSGCRIGPGATIVASSIGDRCEILSSTVRDSDVGDDVRIGPYAHLRSGARVERGAEIGTSAEIKGSVVGARTKMHHFSYLGDALVGEDVNIGAGAITMNFDGAAKHQTVIEDGAFIGSDTMLRAPVRVGRGARTGGGSVILKDVAPGSVVAGVPGRVIREGTE
jgi:bifunctional UDP-N-acetylglucosamine pyrophosphorylase/glucosamine-1-phosphate N-acetyltransferase